MNKIKHLAVGIAAACGVLTAELTGAPSWVTQTIAIVMVVAHAVIAFVDAEQDG